MRSQPSNVQVLASDLRGDQNPVLAAVGPMQFEVVEDRMTNEFNAPIRIRFDCSVARRTDAAGASGAFERLALRLFLVAMAVYAWKRLDHH